MRHHRVLRVALTAMLIAGGAGAWEESLVQRGSEWVRTVRGSEPIPPRGKLRISAAGPVQVSGAQTGELRFAYTQRVRAGSEQEARALLGAFRVATSRRGETTVLEASFGGSGRARGELRVEVPRGLAGTAIETRGGAVEAAGLDGSLAAQTGGGRIRLDGIGGSVLARTSGGDVDLGTILGSVRCISAGGPIRAREIHGDARLETAGGDIHLGEVRGRVSTVSAGGAIFLRRAGSSVTANTAGGAIEVGQSEGMVTAHSAGGPIAIGSAAGVRCETGSGAIRLANVTGALRALTAMGNIDAQIRPGGSPAESFLSTGAGDITVVVPSNVGVAIEAQNELPGGIRRIVSDYPDVRIREAGRYVVAEGAVNGGGPPLRISGAGGTIYIRRGR